MGDGHKNYFWVSSFIRIRLPRFTGIQASRWGGFVSENSVQLARSYAICNLTSSSPTDIDRSLNKVVGIC